MTPLTVSPQEIMMFWARSRQILGMRIWEIYEGKGVAILLSRIWEIYKAHLKYSLKGFLVGSWLCSCYFLWHKVGGPVTWDCLSIWMEGLRWCWRTGDLSWVSTRVPVEWSGTRCCVWRGKLQPGEHGYCNPTCMMPCVRHFLLPFLFFLLSLPSWWSLPVFLFAGLGW